MQILHQGVESVTVQAILANHKKGGVIYTRQELLEIQSQSIYRQMQIETDKQYKSVQTTEDPISQ